MSGLEAFRDAEPWVEDADAKRNERQFQAWSETAAKSRRGILAFPIAFLLVGGLSGDLQALAPVWLAFGVPLFGATLVRAAIVFRFDRWYPLSPGRWKVAFALALLGSVFPWSGYTAWLLFQAPGSPASSLALLVSTAFVGQSIVMYPASYVLVVSYIVGQVLPLFAAWTVLFLQGRLESEWLAGGAVVYCLYCLASARAVSRNLWTRLRRSQQLREARDRLAAEVSLRAEMYDRIAAELEEKEQDYQRIYRQAHDAILVIEPESEVVLEANDRACEIYGFKSDKLVGMSLLEVSVNPDLGREKVAETLDVGHFLSFETRQRRADGSIMDLEINASVIQYRGETAILSINRDVTDRKRAEELRLAKEAAERMSEAKGRFLANMSHEIRTPMAGMIGLANLLRQSDLAERETQWVETLYTSAESLLLILDDVLDLSKIEDGKVDLESKAFDLRQEIGRVVDLSRVGAESKGLDLEARLAPDLPPLVVGDPGRLRQVMLNLLSNAVKFTHEGGVTVTANWFAGGKGEVGRVEIAVRDTGIGIEAAHRDLIFDAFTQRDASTSRRYGGTGLGLTICRRLVGLMGGEIGVESEPGVGTQFRFSLPFGLPDEEARTGGSPSDAAPADSDRHRVGGRVLLVEDNAVNRLVALAELERLGVEADAVADGAEALERIQTERFDLVLMDVQMPGLDGYETTRRIRKAENGDEPLPIVALTAHALQDDRERCLAAGMDDYLAKPVRQEDLAATLRRWLPARDAAGGDVTS